MRVEGQHHLYKTVSGAIVNTDKKAYESAKKRKADQQRLTDVENRLERIEKLLERIANGNPTN